MDPFTLALATFGVQKLRGKSTKRALRDAAIIGGGSYALGAAGVGGSTFTGAPLSSARNFLGMGQTTSGLPQLPFEATQGAQFRNPGYQKALSVGAETAKKDPKGIQALLQKAKDNKLETALIASSVLPLLGGEEEAPEPIFTEEDYKQAYKEQSQKLEGGFKPVENAMTTSSEVFG